MSHAPSSLPTIEGRSRAWSSRRRHICTLTLAYALLVAGPASASSIIEISGSTFGCFDAGCSTFDTPIFDSTYGLTFTGTAFDVFTDPAGFASDILLGTLSRGNVNVSDDTEPLLYTLQLAFGLPTGMTGGQAWTTNAVINGSTPGGGGPLTADFDNTWHVLTFSNGSFEFAVPEDLQIAKNHTVPLYGSVRYATLDESLPDSPSAEAPEPVSLLLFGTALCGVAMRCRRKETKRTNR